MRVSNSREIGKGSIQPSVQVRTNSERRERDFCRLYYTNIKRQAVKEFSRSFLRDQKTWTKKNDKMVVLTALEKVELEIALMKRLRHPNLVQLIDVVDDEQQDQ